MTIQYTRAKRENTNVLVAWSRGRAGPARPQCMPPCRLAAGICGEEPFAVLDTEARRGLHYADDYDFEHMDLGPPFTPDRYLESIRALAKRGFRAVVVDSMSHEWEGEGGVLEMADKDTAKSPSNWIKPKAAHKRLVNGLLQVGTNLIFCLRAQEKVEVVADPDRVAERSWCARLGGIRSSEKRFLFEMTASFTLRPDAPGVVDLSLPHKLQDQHRMAFPPGQHISHEAGVLLGAWARGDAIETPDKELWDGGRKKANDGRAALKAWRDSLTDDQRRAIRPIGDELNNTAREADRNLEGAPF